MRSALPEKPSCQLASRLAGSRKGPRQACRAQLGELALHPSMRTRGKTIPGSSATTALARLAVGGSPPSQHTLQSGTNMLRSQHRGPRRSLARRRRQRPTPPGRFPPQTPHAPLVVVQQPRPRPRAAARLHPQQSRSVALAAAHALAPILLLLLLITRLRQAVSRPWQRLPPPWPAGR